MSGEAFFSLISWGGMLLILAIVYFMSLPEERRRETRERQRAEERRREWELSIEPAQRNRSTYPSDWEIRRMEVFFRERGHCKSCGRRAGHAEVSEANRWRHVYSFARRGRGAVIAGAHVHHRVPLASGGSHALENLELLCEACHLLKHPRNVGLRVTAARNRVPRMLVGADAKVKTARKFWSCKACGQRISKGDRYFGGRYAKLCLGCGRRHRRYPSSH